MTIPAGTPSTEVSVRVVGDIVDDRTLDEGDEGSGDTTFTVDMTNPSDRTV